MPVILLRFEGAAVCLAAVVSYAVLGSSWWLFALVLLMPDLSMLGYFAGPRFGSWAYNAAHVTLWPLALLVAGYFAASPMIASIGLIWLAHIGLDRALGYGLKLPTAFQDTHLGRIGRD